MAASWKRRGALYVFLPLVSSTTTSFMLCPRRSGWRGDVLSAAAGWFRGRNPPVIAVRLRNHSSLFRPIGLTFAPGITLLFRPIGLTFAPGITLLFRPIGLTFAPLMPVCARPRRLRDFSFWAHPPLL